MPIGRIIPGKNKTFNPFHMSAWSRKKLTRIVLVFGLFFVALFVFRLLYGYYGATNYAHGFEEGSSFFNNLTNLRKNYASEKLTNFNNSGTANPALPQDNTGATQKYEKTATVSCKTSHFEEDEALIRKAIVSFNGSIQYEQSLGKKGSRQVYLSVGVKPAIFDSFYRSVQSIGELRSTVITKVDKTNEYRQLNAKIASLKNTLSSLDDLKNRSGAVGDFVQLHDKILEIETQLQELGVQLGDFNTENEFCTLRFSLLEGAAITKTNLYQRIKIALEWTIKYYVLSVVGLASVLVIAFILILLIDRLKLVPALLSRLKD
jgi:hypothetical protein